MLFCVASSSLIAMLTWLISVVQVCFTDRGNADLIRGITSSKKACYGGRSGGKGLEEIISGQL